MSSLSYYLSERQDGSAVDPAVRGAKSHKGLSSQKQKELRSVLGSAKRATNQHGPKQSTDKSAFSESVLTPLRQLEGGRVGSLRQRRS